jgi:hypothetical protein
LGFAVLGLGAAVAVSGPLGVVLNGRCCLPACLPVLTGLLAVDALGCLLGVALFDGLLFTVCLFNGVA